VDSAYGVAERKLSRELMQPGCWGLINMPPYRWHQSMPRTFPSPSGEEPNPTSSQHAIR
jgi:hypothetical protein